MCSLAHLSALRRNLNNRVYWESLDFLGENNCSCSRERARERERESVVRYSFKTKQRIRTYSANRERNTNPNADAHLTLISTEVDHFEFLTRFLHSEARKCFPVYEMCTNSNTPFLAILKTDTIFRSEKYAPPLLTSRYKSHFEFYRDQTLRIAYGISSHQSQNIFFVSSSKH